MSVSSSSGSEKEDVESIYKAESLSITTEEPPMSEWSSLNTEKPEENKKKLLHAEGLYNSGSGEICGKYIAISHSDVERHVYYKYPAVHNPGIKEAILSPEKPTIYDDNGKDLYLALCKEMNIIPVNIFYRGLLSDEINLNYYCVSPKGVRAIAMALQYNKYVQKLSFVDNFLNDDACYHLGQMLNSNDTLTELNLSGCRIGASGILRLGDKLHKNHTLVLLDISKNNLEEDGGKHFADQLFKGAKVKNINLSKNNLGKDTAFALAEVFEFRNIITHLDLSWNNFYHPLSFAKMIDQLADSDVLQQLNLSWNSLEGVRVAKSIQNILQVPSLTYLNLSNNRLHDESIQIIVSNLKKAKKLVTLDLSFNPLTSKDAEVALEEMLKPRVKLNNLLMEGVFVNKSFLLVLDSVMKMKSRKNFKVVYDGVLSNYTIVGPDFRELVLKRADYLSNQNKKHKVMDVTSYFSGLHEEFSKPIPVKDLMDRIALDGAPFDADLVSEMANAFPGPASSKNKLIDLEALCDFCKRMWPERELSTTKPTETPKT